MNLSVEKQYQELAFYTLSLQDKTFIHQYIVDAYTAQTADSDTKPIAIVFALVGLYLCVEKNYSGRQIQLIHIQMSKGKKIFPMIILPIKRGDVNVADVLDKHAGPERDEMIKKWCVSVWGAYNNSRETIIDIFEQEIGGLKGNG